MDVLGMALMIIKTECEQHHACDVCPLYNKYYKRCGVQTTAPTNWDLYLKSDNKFEAESED